MLRGSLPSRSLSIIALLAFAGALLPIPGADAQLGTLLGGPPREETLLPDAVAPVEVLTDPEGDTEFMGNTPLGAPDPGGAEDYESTADIVSLTLAENQHALLFGLKHAAYPETTATLSQLILFQNLWCSIEFHVNGDDTRFYEIRLDSENFLDDGNYASFSVLYVHEQAGDDPDDFDRERVDFPWSAMIGYDHFEIVVGKEALEADGTGRSLRIGDRITDIYVECGRALTLLVEYYDEAGGDAQPSIPYKLSAATRSNEISIGFPEVEEGQSSALTVAPEGATKLNVIIKNLRERKLLVNVTATLKDPTGAPLQGWTASAAPTFEIQANSSLPASIIITPPPGVQHRDGGYLTVRAIPLGFDDHVQITRWVSAVVSPTPDQNTLYFHNAPWSWYYCVFICTGSDDAIPSVSHGPDMFVMNTLPTDEQFGEEDTDNQGIAMFSSDETYVSLDAPLGQELRLDPDGTFDLTMSLRTDVERDVGVRGYLYSGENVLGAFETTVTVGASFQQYTVQFIPDPDQLTVPAGSGIGLAFYHREADIPISFTGGTTVDSIDWRPSESSLTLPLVAVPKKVVNITDGRALPTLALSNDTDAEEYLNPGATQAFDMFLINEGIDQDVVGLKADVPDGWTVSFHPGDQFELEPGASAPLCVSIKAPDDAQDSDTVEVNLTAWSRSDPDVRTSAALTLIVIDQIEIEERTCVNEEYVRPFTERERATPGAPAAALIGIIALLGAVLRRRL